jgi:hypothetical protein
VQRSYRQPETPGHIALCLISLESQKDAIMQWLGKDNLSKYNTLKPAVTFKKEAFALYYAITKFGYYLRDLFL